jgi:hypothetical protein
MNRWQFSRLQFSLAALVCLTMLAVPLLLGLARLAITFDWQSLANDTALAVAVFSVCTIAIGLAVWLSS